MEILEKNQEETLEIKTTITEMKNASDGLLSRLDTAEKRITELEDIILLPSCLVSEKSDLTLIFVL